LKIAEAKMLADLVKQYHESTAEQRAEMVVDRKKFGIVPKGIREQRKKRQSCIVFLVFVCVPGEIFSHEDSLSTCCTGYAVSTLYTL
jgi:hypothetical protein